MNNITLEDSYPWETKISAWRDQTPDEKLVNFIMYTFDLEECSEIDAVNLAVLFGFTENQGVKELVEGVKQNWLLLNDPHYYL